MTGTIAHLTEAEVIRRLRALLAMPPAERPISIDMLERAAGISASEIYPIAKRGSMMAGTLRKLGRALLLLENDQLVIHRHPNLKAEITVRAPQPPLRMVRVVEVTAKGPRLRLVAQNPNAFPSKS